MMRCSSKQQTAVESTERRSILYVTSFRLQRAAAGPRGETTTKNIS